MDPVRVPGAHLLAEGASRTFSVLWKGRQREAFLLRHQGHLVAFLNECPHWSVELDLGDGHFYDPELDRIYCKNHGALFVLPSGVCDSGPCAGSGLHALSVQEEQGTIVVMP